MYQMKALGLSLIKFTPLLRAYMVGFSLVFICATPLKAQYIYEIIHANCIGDYGVYGQSGTNNWTISNSSAGTITNMGSTCKIVWNVAGTWNVQANGANYSVTINPATPSVTVSSTPSGTVCQGSSVTLTANTTATSSQITWSGTNIPANSHGTTLVVNPSATTTYTAAVSCGCKNGSGSVITNYGSITINVNPSPTVTPTITLSAPNINPYTPGYEICPGTNITFTATANSTALNPQYKWTNLAGTVLQNGASNTYTAPTLAKGDKITVTVTESNPCLAQTTASTFVSVYSPTIYTVSGGGAGSNCQSFPISISGMESVIGLSFPLPIYYLYKDGVYLSSFNGTGSSVPVVIGNYSAPGTYTVKAVSGNCVMPMAGSAVITNAAIISYPATVSANPGLWVKTGTPTTITLSGGSDYYWYTQPTGGTLLFHGAAYSPTTTTAGAYNFWVAVASPGGCIGPQRQEITLMVDQWNTVHSTSFDRAGNLVGESKAYADLSGRTRQTQSRDVTKNNKIVSESIYDGFSRGAIQTMAAPVPFSGFTYDHNYTNDYNTSNFEGAKTGTPDPIPTTSDLGKYYSTANTTEPYAPVSAYPFSQTQFYADPTSRVQKSASAGETFKLGSGRESMSMTFPVLDELNYYSLLRSRYIVGSPIVSLHGMTVKTVIRDGEGKEAVSFADRSGHTLATALCGLETGITHPALPVSAVIPLGQYLEFHLPDGFTNYTVTGGTYTLTNIETDVVLSSAPTTKGFYRILSTGTTAVTLSYSLTYHDFTYYIYDNAGNLTVTIPPKNTEVGLAALTTSVLPGAIPSAMLTQDYMVTIDTVNAAGWLLSSKTPDGGLVQNVYRQDGTLCYSRNDHQKANKRFSYILYDSEDRPTEIGEYQTGAAGDVGFMDAVTYQKASTTTCAATYASSIYSEPSSPDHTTYGYFKQDPTIANKLVTYKTAYYEFGTRVDYSTRVVTNPGSTTLQVSSGIPAGVTDAYGTEFVSTSGAYAGTASPVVLRGAGFDHPGMYVLTNDVSSFNYTTYTPPAPCTPTHPANTVQTYLEPGQQSSFPTTGRQQTTNYYYDLPVPSAEFSALVLPASYQQHWLMGKLSKSWNSEVVSYYSYNERGQPEWLVQRINAMPAGSQVKTIDYVYDDNTGRLIATLYQKNSPTERFSHYYTYDVDGRLTQVQTSTDDPAGTPTKLLQENLLYYAHGPVKRVELGGNTQGVDYVYTLQGWIKSINHPSLDKTQDPGQDGVSNGFNPDAFGMSLDYFSGDYTRPNTHAESYAATDQAPDHYSGNVKAWRWRTLFNTSVGTLPGFNTPSMTEVNQEQMYVYQYDGKDQLQSALFGNYVNNAFVRDATQRFDEFGLSYDPNGNLKTLNRNAYQAPNMANNQIDRLNYNYYPNKNQLQNIRDASTAQGTLGDLKDQTTSNNYVYDEIGELTSDASQNNTIQYDAFGMVTAVKQAIAPYYLVVTFAYDDGGNRVRKVSYNATGAITSTTFYVRDAGGTLLSVYTQAGTGGALVQTEVPIAGGTFYRQTGLYVYELKDHLGNVRAVLARKGPTDTQINSQYFADYYPFGWVMPGREQNAYRYKFQGQEYDGETGEEAFQLRIYDGRIGRWMTIDPKGQHFSPYLSMGNNPVLKTDPNGGEDGDPPGFFGRLFIRIFGSSAANDALDFALSLGDRVTDFGKDKRGDYVQYSPDAGDWTGGKEGDVNVKYFYTSGKLRMDKEIDNDIYRSLDRQGKIRHINEGLQTTAFPFDEILLATGVGEAAIALRGAGSLAVEETGIQMAARLGREGEQAVGLTGPKVGVRMPSGKMRFPDEITPFRITEVKNTVKLSYTAQLRDYAAYAQENNLEFLLYTKNENFSGPLEEAINNGLITRRQIP